MKNRGASGRSEVKSAMMIEKPKKTYTTEYTEIKRKITNWPQEGTKDIKIATDPHAPAKMHFGQGDAETQRK